MSCGRFWNADLSCNLQHFGTVATKRYEIFTAFVFCLTTLSFATVIDIGMGYECVELSKCCSSKWPDLSRHGVWVAVEAGCKG